MRDLLPKGVPVEIGGKERHFVFNLNVVDELQERCDEPLSEVLAHIFSGEKDSNDYLKTVVTALINEDVAIHNDESDEKWPLVDVKSVGRMITIKNRWPIMQAIMQAYTEGLPEVDKDENFQTDESPKS
jgi:hypothetical protein